MNIIVCIKQVPGTTQVEIDPETGVLKRDGVESKMNPYDLYALETALRIKESYGAEVTVITIYFCLIGSVREHLKNALYIHLASVIIVPSGI